MDSKTAYRFLAQFGGIDFLIQHYEIEHTLSLDDAIDDLEMVCRRNGGVFNGCFPQLQSEDITNGELITNKIKALIEGVTRDIIADLVEEDNISIEKAMDILFNSDVFTKLSDSETGLYRESSAYVTELLRNELTNGKFV